MNRRYEFVSPTQFPRFDGTTAPDSVKISGVTALTSRIVPTLAGTQVVEAQFIDGFYRPNAEDFAWLAGRDVRMCGWVRQRLHLPPREGRPVVLFLYGPCFEVAEEDGNLRYRWAPLPQDFDPDLRLHAELDAQIIKRLGHSSIEGCARATLVPARTIEIIADSLGSWQRDAMRGANARPQHIAVTRVRLLDGSGVRDETLHVVAGDTTSGRVWTLAVLDWALGAEDLAACLAEELVNLPHPHALQSIATPRDLTTRAIVREALAMTKCSCPSFAARAIVAWRRNPEWDELLWIATATERLGHSLEALARETPLSVEHLEKRALVRQGYRAALHWPLTVAPLGGRSAPSWAEAAE